MNVFKKTILPGLALAAAGLQASLTVPNAAQGDTSITFPEATGALARAGPLADKFTIYEGLPHSFEGKAFVENEIRTKLIILFDENWFYLPSQKMLPEDQTDLQRLFGAGLFKPWRGVKFCGGFHGDYAVSFESVGSTYRVLICFGCHEARILRLPPDGPNPQGVTKFRLTTDLTDAGYQELRELFKKYRQQRPPMPDPKAKAVKPPGPPPVPVRL